MTSAKLEGSAKFYQVWENMALFFNPTSIKTGKKYVGVFIKQTHFIWWSWNSEISGNFAGCWQVCTS